MLFSYLLKGLVIGFSLALPVGPIALLCIRRTLARGPASGVASGMGAATADGVYGLIAGFGITFISNFLFSHNIILRLIGGCVLCYLGVKIFLTVPGENRNSGVENGLVHDYVSALLLTLDKSYDGDCLCSHICCCGSRGSRRELFGHRDTRWGSSPGVGALVADFVRSRRWAP